jgi:hypothetical protein
MMIRPIALLAVLCPGCVRAADLPNAPVAVYYSFDSPPSAVLFTEMQAELDRILAPAELRVTWRPIDSPRNGAEYFPGVVVFRFHGSCLVEQVSAAAVAALDSPGNVSPGIVLADTERVDGHILPFGEVECDQLRRFMAPALKSLRAEEQNAALGRAVARVSAHEIYHMLTGSRSHGRQGIASASHSLSGLAGATFNFANKETKWLRAWVNQQAGKQSFAPADSGDTESEARGTGAGIWGR